MIKLVEAEFKGKSNGISFDSFKTFYNVLFGGADLERAMFFLDSENQGVTRDEFGKVANWVVGTNVDPHVIEVVLNLLFILISIFIFITRWSTTCSLSSSLS